MFFPLRLRAPISRFHHSEPDDVIRTKVRLLNLGFYQEPDYGLTPYPDDAMFDGIKAFQRKNDLEIDGVMQPAGPTEERMHQILAELSELRGGDDEVAGADRSPTPSPEEHDLAVRWRYGPFKRRRIRKGECDRKFAADTKVCDKLGSTKGAYAVQRCRASAMLRYGNCLSGRPVPPLDMGD